MFIRIQEICQCPTWTESPRFMAHWQAWTSSTHNPRFRFIFPLLHLAVNAAQGKKNPEVEINFNLYKQNKQAKPPQAA